MSSKIAEHWNERYGNEEFAYGIEPNEYFKQKIKEYAPGKILFPAEGEGRNAVYAITKGWVSTAFDLSSEGKNKALKLAKENSVSINYEVGELQNLNFQPEEFDAAVLVFAHFQPELRTSLHRDISKLIKKDGIIILEGFSKKHLEYQAENNKVGGPRDEGMLFSTEMIESDFSGFEIIELLETETELSEGLYHQGKASVIRFVGKKK